MLWLVELQLRMTWDASIGHASPLASRVSNRAVGKTVVKFRITLGMSSCATSVRTIPNVLVDGTEAGGLPSLGPERGIGGMKLSARREVGVGGGEFER